MGMYIRFQLMKREGRKGLFGEETEDGVEWFREVEGGLGV
jgi:hypothetical protein